MKTFYLETYGCQMNEYDSLIANEILTKDEFVQVKSASEADVILINTCSVRENAHQKIYNRLKSLAHLYRSGTKIGILGCMAQAMGESLLKEDMPVNFVLGPDSLRNLLTSINTTSDTTLDAKKTAFVEKSRTETYSDIIPTIDHHSPMETPALSASVAIQRGCDNFCTFCIVPFTRGRERSRDPESIIQEIKALTDCDIASIVLLGQNVNSYKHDQTSFTGLIKRILEETTLPRIYFQSPHPKDFPVELINITKENERMGTWIHIPLQSGNDEILKLMRREYTVSEFLNLIDKVRNAIPNVAISTDVIVGFPTETDAQYNDTLKVMELANFDFAYMFAYSERPHTTASRDYKDNLTADVKQERLSKLIELQRARAAKINKTYEGKEVKILVEGLSKRSDKEIAGTMRNSKKVIAPIPHGSNLHSIFAKEVSVRITSSNTNTLFGEIII